VSATAAGRIKNKPANACRCLLAAYTPTLLC
jgi:hypothetical protein